MKELDVQLIYMCASAHTNSFAWFMLGIPGVYVKACDALADLGSAHDCALM